MKLLFHHVIAVKAKKLQLRQSFQEGSKINLPDPATIMKLKNDINQIQYGDTKIWRHPLH